MQYIIMCVIALAACVGCGWLLAWQIVRTQKLKRSAVASIALALSILLICGVVFGYLSVYYHADTAVVLTASEVSVTEIDGGYFFDGPGADTAMIFYPGAKVETLAYAPLMISLAEKGVDCFLADMPFRMAILGSNTADQFLNAYSYDNWIAAGHSMGGLVISGYAARHADRIHGLALLASYPGSTIPDGIRLCSIYGTRDGCLNRNAYEQAKAYWPMDAFEYILEGGNHAQYGNYGPQSGDLLPAMSREEQQAQTVEILLNMIGQ